MPRATYACADCRREFEVSRPTDDFGEVLCPFDGGLAIRFFRPPLPEGVTLASRQRSLTHGHSHSSEADYNVRFHPGQRITGDMKLFLYSAYLLHPQHRASLAELVGKPEDEITFAAIANATDFEADSDEWVSDSIRSLSPRADRTERVDLREWKGNQVGLRKLLATKDVIWLSGGNTFYLRWLLKETGADETITDLVLQGSVYSGWSAGAIVAGPTLRNFEPMEDMTVVPEVIYDGLGLTEGVTLPHMDLEEFGMAMRKAGMLLEREDYPTIRLDENQAFTINGSKVRLLRA